MQKASGYFVVLFPSEQTTWNEDENNLFFVKQAMKLG